MRQSILDGSTIDNGKFHDMPRCGFLPFTVRKTSDCDGWQVVCETPENNPLRGAES